LIRQKTIDGTIEADDRTIVHHCITYHRVLKICMSNQIVFFVVGGGGDDDDDEITHTDRLGKAGVGFPPVGQERSAIGRMVVAGNEENDKHATEQQI
jgi:hypothetical protein